MSEDDPRTEDSLPAAAPDGSEEGVTESALLAPTEDRITPVVLGRMLVSVGRSITDEDDLLTLLQSVVRIAHDVIDGADSAGVTIDLGGRTFTAVHSDNRTLRVDSEQYEAGEGPCLHASRNRTVVVVQADEAAQRWPRFAAAAAEEGIHSFLAAPLGTSEQTLGSFNLYGRTPLAFDSLDADILDLITTAVARAIGDFARFKTARDVAEGLERALESRAPIEQAKGMLMAIHGIDADSAFDLLRTQSQNTNTRLHTVAVNLVRQLSTPTPPANDYATHERGTR